MKKTKEIFETVSPKPGITTLSYMKSVGTLLNKLNFKLRKELAKLDNSILSKFKEDINLFQVNENGLQILNKEKAKLISSSLILNWFCLKILKQISKNDGILKAEMKFHNRKKEFCLTNQINLDEINQLLKSITDSNVSMSLNTLPYICEVFETESEVMTEQGAKRKKKKKNGIYYTPTDLVDFIIEKTIANSDYDSKQLVNATWLDPAIGTGLFPLRIVHKLKGKLDLLKITGFDVSPFALLASNYILCTSKILYSNKGTNNLKKLVNAYSANLFLCDATKIKDKKALNKIFPDINDGVDFIISNPPYSKTTNSQLSFFESAISNNKKTSSSIFIDFIHQIHLLSKSIKGSGGSMVIPLSLTYNSQKRFKALRQFLIQSNLNMNFYNFDRTPDSLFGDDVKTRNTIICLDRSDTKLNEIHTTYLARWSSRNRNELFNKINTLKIPEKLVTKHLIPKIGSQNSLNIYTKLKSGKDFFGDLAASSTTLKDVSYKSTAYNWIPSMLNTKENITSGTKFIRSLDSTKLPNACIYGLLSSRLTFWLWRIEGDGFHVTNNFIYSLPYGKEFLKKINVRELDRLSNLLWTDVQSHLIITNNANVDSVSFCPYKSESILSKIDLLIMNGLSLPKYSRRHIKTFTDDLMVAGRENELDITNKLKYLKN